MEEREERRRWRRCKRSGRRKVESWRRGQRKGQSRGQRRVQNRVTEEACEEDERCEEESECHSAPKRERVCATFTDSQENAIVEFVKEHPELCDKEHGRFHDRHRKEALWVEICRTEAPALLCEKVI